MLARKDEAEICVDVIIPIELVHDIQAGRSTYRQAVRDAVESGNYEVISITEGTEVWDG